MYIHIRSIRILRNTMEAMRITGELRRLVNANTSTQTEMWISAFSTAPGTLAFTTRVEGRSEVIEAQEKLMTVPEISGLIEELRPHATPPEDQFRYVLNADSLDMEAGSSPIVWTTNAQVDGDLGAAFEWSLEMATFAGAVAGSNVMVTANTIGPFGQLGWAIGFDSMADADAAEMALWNDPGYMERISKANEAGLFMSGVGGQSLWTRMD